MSNKKQTITSLREEGVEWIISSTNGLVWWHLTIRLDSMFKAVELPASITDLDTSLADVNRDTLALQKKISISQQCTLKPPILEPSGSLAVVIRVVSGMTSR